MPFQSPNHTQTPNDLFDEYLPLMGEAELRVVMAIVRLTYGYHVTRAKASLSKLQKMTGMSKQGVLNGAHDAEARGLIRHSAKKTGSEWVVHQVDSGSPPSRPPKPKGSPPSRPHINKDDLKEIYKEITPYPTSTFEASWFEWIEYREKKKKPISELAMRKQFKQFKGMTEAEAIEMIDHAIAKDWQGLWEVKKQNGHAPKPSQPVQYAEEH